MYLKRIYSNIILKKITSIAEGYQQNRLLFSNQNIQKQSFGKRTVIMGRTSTTVVDEGPIQNAITEGLTEKLAPIHLEVINESYMHNVPKGSETHFKVLVVTDKFEPLTLIKRHRLVNDIVKEKLDGNFVHALSIEAKTPIQWNPDYKVSPSPNCKGGFGK